MMSDCIDHGQAGNTKGYTNVYVGGGRAAPRRNGLHRQVWSQAHGPIPDGMVVMHSCDNPRCINLDHLSVGTYSENTLDAVAKGRLASRPGPKGEVNVKAKLNEYAVRWIRSLPRTQDELAEMFGVTQTTISKIVRRRTWQHVT